VIGMLDIWSTFTLSAAHDLPPVTFASRARLERFAQRVRNCSGNGSASGSDVRCSAG